jgi:IS5 family transposase
MLPKQSKNRDLFRELLENQLNPRHELVKLSKVIDWDNLESNLNLGFGSVGCRPLPTRLMVGLIMLQSMYGLSDEDVVSRWVENAYWQYFCGYEYLQWDLPCNPSSLTRWRKRLGKEGLEKILSATVSSGVKSGCVKEKSFKDVVVDTTVMPKAIAHPTDSKLLHRAINHLSKAAKSENIVLRQSYVRVAKESMFKASRYAHAKQFKRMNKEVKKLKTYLGRLIRDITRKREELSNNSSSLDAILSVSNRLWQQKKNDKKKLYSLHAPEVSCIAKGKAHTPYEFGCKVSLVVTHKEGFVTSSQALHNNPYDGHTLSSALEYSEKITGIKVENSFVDKGYKGNGVDASSVYISGQRRGMTNKLTRMLKRRQMIEPYIGHMKESNRLGRNYLKGEIGDKINAIMAGIGHNLLMIKRHIAFLLFKLWSSILQQFFYIQKIAL